MPSVLRGAPMRMPAHGPAHGPGVTHAQVAAVESVLHREEARPFPGRQLVLAGEHAAVVRLHVADDGQAAAVPNAVQRAVEHRQPPVVREGLGDVRRGVTHQALELLTHRFDVGPVDRVRFPAPAGAVVGQPDGLAAREDDGASSSLGRSGPVLPHRRAPPPPPSFPPGPC